MYKTYENTFIITFAALFAFSACSADPAKTNKSTAVVVATPTMSANDDTNSVGVAAAATPRPKIDPLTSRIDLVGDVSVTSASTDGKIQLPTVPMKFTEADFVEIIRCSSMYNTATMGGVKIKDIKPGASLPLIDLKSAYYEAFRSNLCRPVAGTSDTIADNFGISREKWYDFGADSGSFYYIINPCISKERSLSPSEQCSFNIVVTNEYTYKNTFKIDFVKKAAEVSIAESRLGGYYNKLRFIAGEVKHFQDTCEKNFAYDSAANNFWKGLGTLLITSVGTAIGGGVGGAPAAMSSGRAALTLSTMIFSFIPDAKFKCPLAADAIERGIQTQNKIVPAISEWQKAINELAIMNVSIQKMDQVVLTGKGVEELINMANGGASTTVDTIKVTVTPLATVQ